MEFNSRNVIDYNPLASKWGEALFFGDVRKVKMFIDSAPNLTDLFEKRVSLLRLPAILQVIFGAREEVSKDVSDHLATLHLLIDNGCRIGCQDVNGSTPLHHCLSVFDPELGYKMLQLLLDCDADPNIANRFGCTPLHDCILTDKPQFVKLLLKYNADVGLVDNEGMSSLQLASLHPGIGQIVSKFFLKKAAKDKLENGGKSCSFCGAISANKRCPCLVTTYCNKLCQTEHWKSHKKSCQEATKKNIKAGLASYANDDGKKYKFAVKVNYAAGEVLTEKCTEPGKPNKRYFIVKVQLSIHRPNEGGMYVYNKNRSYCGHIYKDNAIFEALYNKVRSEGVVGGMKGYFYAEESDNGDVVIQVDNILPPESW